MWVHTNTPEVKNDRTVQCGFVTGVRSAANIAAIYEYNYHTVIIIFL